MNSRVGITILELCSSISRVSDYPGLNSRAANGLKIVSGAVRPAIFNARQPPLISLLKPSPSTIKMALISDLQNMGRVSSSDDGWPTLRDSPQNLKTIHKPERLIELQATNPRASDSLICVEITDQTAVRWDRGVRLLPLGWSAVVCKAAMQDTALLPQDHPF